MISRIHLQVLALALTQITACSLVLAPSRRQADGPADAATPDAPGLDAGLDAPPSDAPPTDAPLADVPGSPGDTGTADTGTADTGTPDAPDAPGPVCPLDFTCIPAAPAGWMGPIVFLSGPAAGSAPACPASAPSQAFTAQSSFGGAPASCGCSCGAPTSGMSCGSANLISTNASCTAGSTTIATLADGACQAVTMPTSGGWTLSRPAFSASGASCTPTPSVSVPPSTAGASHRACSVPSPTACGAAMVCAPTPTAAQPVCVYIDGDATCPAGFPNTYRTGQGVTDTRGCTPCTCGSVTGMCNAFVTLENGCPGSTYYGDVVAGGCTPAFSVPGSRATADFTPVGSCSPSTSAPTGGLTPIMPRTVCCTE